MLRLVAALSAALALVGGCQYGYTPILADLDGIGELCASTEDCPRSTIFGLQVQLSCLTEYEGGYCAVPDCVTGLECPSGSLCLLQSDGKNYCVRGCRSDADCNVNRSEHEASCSSDFQYADESGGPEGVDACLPPAAG